MKTKAREAVFVVEGGTVTALAGGPLSLADMGTRTTKRASHLEFSALGNFWTVADAATGEIIHTDPDYDRALEWERKYYNEKLSAD